MAQEQRRSLADRITVDPRLRNSIARNLKDVADGTVLVGQINTPYDGTSNSALIIDVELVSAEWMFQFSIENDSKGQREKEETTEVGMTVTSGKETSDSVSASAGFSGWGFSASVNASTETKTFTSLETTSKKTVRDTYIVPAESSIFVYKRKYKFRCRAWLYDGNANAYYEASEGKLESSFATEIIANQELISPTELRNHGRITNNPPSGLVITQKRRFIPDRDITSIFWLLAFKQTYPWVQGSLDGR